MSQTGSGVANGSDGAARGHGGSSVNTLLGAAALMVVVAGLRAFGGSLGPFFLALVLVIIAHPIHRKLLELGAPRWLAFTALLVASYGILLMLIVVVVIALATFVNHVATADYSDRFAEWEDAITRQLDRIGITGDDIEVAISSIDLQTIAGRAISAATGLIGVLSTLFVLVLTMLFVAMDSDKVARLLRGRLAVERPLLADSLSGFATSTRQYFVVNTVFGLIVAALDAGLLLACGVSLAIVWGVLSLVASYIPNIGFLISMIPPVILALLERSVTVAIVVVVGYFVINTLVDSVIKPKFVGEAVGLSATLTFVSLIFWSWVFGPLGALLAVPLTLLVAAVLVDADPSAHWMKPIISLADGELDEAPPVHAELEHTDSGATPPVPRKA